MENITNIIKFPSGRTLAVKANKISKTRSGVEKRLDENFRKFLDPILTIKLYRKYLKDANNNNFDLAHIAWVFGESIARDVEMYRKCFRSLASNDLDAWSISDYQKVLSILLSVNPKEFENNKLLSACIDELVIKIRGGSHISDKLYDI